MKIVASFLLVLFTVFLITPTFVTLVDESVDVSLAFTASEEENSPKNQIAFEYTFQDVIPNSLGYHYFQKQNALNHSYRIGYRLIFLDVLFPPPKQV